jgi:hypothetical protein
VRSPHYEGQQSLPLRGGDGGVYDDLFPFHAGTKIQVSAYATTDTGGTGLALLRVSDTGENNVVGPRATGSKWQKFTMQFTASSTQSMRIQLMARGGVVYWDDVEVSAR